MAIKATNTKIRKKSVGNFEANSAPDIEPKNAGIDMAAQVNKNEVIPRQVIELITTGKSAGVEAPTANTGAKNEHD